MKNARKLIPALAMLLVSAILMSTASFAWFSMNETVTATGMQVKAKSNATYLLINTTGTAATGNTSANAVNSGVSKAFYPADYTTTEIDNGVTGEGRVVHVAANKWYTANSSLSTDAMNNVKNYKTLTEVLGDNASYAESDFAKYVLSNVFYLTLSSDSENYTGNLKLTYTETDDEGCVATIVKIDGAYYELTPGTPTTIENVTLTNSAAGIKRVDVFTFIDGQTTSVKSETDVADLTGTAVVTFGIGST